LTTLAPIIAATNIRVHHDPVHHGFVTASPLSKQQFTGLLARGLLVEGQTQFAVAERCITRDREGDRRLGVKNSMDPYLY
jgi:hypothetical protein